MRPIGGGAGGAVVLFAAVVIAYGIAGALSWQVFGTGTGPVFFLAAGVAVAALVLTPRTRWPVVAAAIATTEMAIDRSLGETWVASAGYALAAVVGPVIGASLVLGWCHGRPDLRERTDLAAFVAGACLIGPAVGGLIGGWVHGKFGDGPWPVSILLWAASDGIGVLTVATPILLWPKQSAILRSRPAEVALVIAVSGALSVAAFWTEAPPSILVLPVLAWAAFRLDMIGTALAGLVMAVLANVMIGQGRGPFAAMDVSLSTRLAITQVWLVVVIMTALLIAQEVAGRSAAIRAREAERRERLRLQALSGLARRLSAALTPDDVGKAVAEQMLNEAGATGVNLGLVSGDGTRLRWVTMAGYSAAVRDEFAGGSALSDRTVATDTARSGQATVLRTAADYARRYPGTAHWLKVSGVESVAGWPLTAGGDPVGALVLVWSQPQRFDAAQQAYLSTVATMVSQALIRAKVYDDEHARALVLQSAVLPVLPAPSGDFDVCVTYEPADVAQGLGGDWYDVMPLPGGRTYFAVGDVVGHGLIAVEDMAQLRSAGRALAHQGLSPVRLLAELNGFTRDASQGRFATMAVAVFDPAAATLSYGCAGHPPPMLRRAGTGEVVLLEEARGPVLGPVTDADYVERTLTVAPGDVLLMYTDGLVERRGVDVAAGIARAAQMLGRWGPHDALTDRCRALQQALASRSRADDVCLLAVRFGEQGAKSAPRP